MTIVVRQGTADDIARLAPLSDALRGQQGDPPGHFGPDAIRRDGFADPQFEIIVAEREGALVGYAIFHDAYETGYGARGVYLCDLYVDPAGRRHHVGRALMARVARDAKARGRSYVWWMTKAWNTSAHAFYRSLGASEEPVIAHALAFDAFDALCAEAEESGKR